MKLRPALERPRTLALKERLPSTFRPLALRLGTNARRC